MDDKRILGYAPLRMASTEFLQQLINGLSLGAFYALIALGYTMVYGVLRFINFAHGDVFMIGAFCGYYLSPRLLPHFTGWMTPLGPISVLVLTMLICALLGIAIEKIAYRPLRSRPKLTVLITAIGVSLFLEYGGQFVFGADPKSFPELMPDRALEGTGALTITTTQLAAFIATVLGGIGNIPGAAVGGIVLGVVETFVGGSAFSTYRDAIAFALLIIILLFRPTGIFGRAQIEKV